MEEVHVTGREVSAPALNLKIYFESLTVNTVDRLFELYTPDAYFKDPFNEVNDSKSIHRIFKHMFTQVDDPRFEVTGIIDNGQEAFLTWDFLFSATGVNKGKPVCCKGSSHLKFSHDGKVKYHRDYWDTAEELYEKLPVIGSLMRWLKKRMS